MLEWVMRRIFRPRHWIIASVFVLIADYATGPFVQFPVLLLIPVAAAAWHGGIQWGLVLATVLPTIHSCFAIPWNVPSSFAYSLLNGLVLIFVFSLVGTLLHQASQKASLQQELKVLHGLLPICSFCKKIRNQTGAWESLERYISEHSEADFTHGLCEACAKRHYGFTLQGNSDAG